MWILRQESHSQLTWSRGSKQPSAQTCTDTPVYCTCRRVLYLWNGRCRAVHPSLGLCRRKEPIFPRKPFWWIHHIAQYETTRADRATKPSGKTRARGPRRPRRTSARGITRARARRERGSFTSFRVEQSSHSKNLPLKNKRRICHQRQIEDFWLHLRKENVQRRTQKEKLFCECAPMHFAWNTRMYHKVLATSMFNGRWFNSVRSRKSRWTCPLQ